VPVEQSGTTPLAVSRLECHTIGVVKGVPPHMRCTKAQVLQQFRFNWQVYVKQNPYRRGDVICKREAWNNFVDRLNEEGYVTDNQAYNWTNPF